MGRLREIPRTAAFAWSLDVKRPCLATGTRAGAVDADFSDETKLELWDLDLSSTTPESELQPLASIVTDSRFYDLAWSQPNGDREEGIIAGGLETGALDLWDASKLRANSEDALISRTTKHTGAIKALQFNPHRPELLATSGNKGELYITDLNNAANPFRLGGSGRADDFDTLDWNKKVPHIMVTGGSGGFVTVWDVKAKKESLTLNNYGRKPVSAVAWNPDVPTKLATAIPSDQEPLILMWDLRNSSAPEKILRGHEQGVLSLSWCSQDNDLLVSCGKDNRNIFWNANTAEPVGEFPIVTNWTFQTRLNPRHPNLIATASFDGKIGISAIQNTRTQVDEKSTATLASDGADFFAKAQTQPQESTFSLAKPPKWLRRPVGVSFGFGGKLISFQTPEDTPNKSKVSVSTFAGDSQVSSSITDFQSALKENDFSALCDAKIENAQTAESKNDWKVIKILLSDSPRKGLLSYLGYAKTEGSAETAEKPLEAKDASSTLGVDETNGASKDANRLSAFFENEGSENQNFLADLAASKGARTNNPFQIYTGSETEAEKQVTKALMLGNFEDALDICLKENRMSDAFMIAICGGQKCIDKAQAAYFGQQANGPNYLRLLASVVGKNLWDVVYNADLANWSEVMATLCTYADQTEFPDLCEALGDRLEEISTSRSDASFCYLAGSKLEKVVPIWLKEMQEGESARTNTAEDESAFSVHVQALQTFIEKVSIFRSVTKYEDKDGQQKASGWRLDPLYSRYAEYADIVATYGYLDLANQLLSLLPAQYPAAGVARNRIQQAGKKAASSRTQQQRLPSRQPSPAVFNPIQPQGLGAAPAPIGTTAPAVGLGAPYGSSLAANRYAAPNQQQAPLYQPGGYGSTYAPPLQNLNASPPPNQTGPPQSSGPPPAKPAVNGSNWNDLPDSFAPKTPSRRGTPAQQGTAQYPAYNASFQPPNSFSPQKPAALPPPPKAGAAPPRVGSPQVNPSVMANDSINRPPSSVANPYAPPPNSGPSLAPQSMPVRSSSPYNPPPSGAAPTSRYAPAPSAGPAGPGGPQSMSGPPPSMARQVAPNPYASQQAMNSFQPPPSHISQQQPPPRQPAAPPPRGPPPANRGPTPSEPPPAPESAQSGRTTTPGQARYPAGDRSHIPPESQHVYDVLNAEMQRIKGRAPESYRAHVEDAEKRINLLFDLLNNDDLRAENVAQLRELASALQSRNFDQALAIHTDLLKNLESSGPWMAGIKRLIGMSRATPPT